MNVGGGNQHAEQNNSWLYGMGGIWCHALLCACMCWTVGAAECMVCIKTLMLNHTVMTMCEQKGNASVGIWAHLVLQRCVMVDLPGEHVERPAILLHACT